MGNDILCEVNMDGRAFADAIATMMIVLIVIGVGVGIGLGWLIPWLWHHLSIGWH
jgi:hypothetical protein